jgi:phosphatidylglycerophosphatase A
LPGRGWFVRARIATALATAGYVGFVPIAPGTFGSAVGLVVYAAVSMTNSWIVEAAVLVVILGLGIWSADHVERALGKDPGPVVIDEVAGMLVTLAFLDVSVTGAVVGFFIFRVLDVVKPPPARRLEDLHGGPGIMFDDVMAGIYSNVALRGLLAFFPDALA